ncbi:hypothetical protein K504DRAFT_459399 [Pleomassaria siparia CBS 279.74]|uniref:PRISE-like Rossmann-fold domain-containing protein n=1 Tax=Pleomassaria siparia CBS 279.74 TaxID=1314801 RepID=A0A6G1K3E2_9PLEO|nr:hypothetical protein K504DRAFT_459399 [Pleomassaria siparia CBS 279.74]
MLQTGAKNYGVHFGPSALPQEETAPRVTLEPNFYYPQEDVLWSFCSTHSIGWNIAMPSYILGAVPDAAMNLAYPLGIYASIRRELGEKLEFPADLRAWEAPHVGSSSRLNAYLEEWAVLDEGTGDQKFNAVDGGPFYWGGAWPKFAEWYGLEAGRPSLDDAGYSEIKTRFEPPPRGFGPPATIRTRFTLVSYMQQPSAQKAWASLLSKHNLKAQRLEDMDVERIFSFADMSLAGSGGLDMSMNKARKLGWHGFVDTTECFREVLDEFVGLGMLPPLGKE